MIDEKFQSIVVYAARYAIGRQTYAVSEVVSFVIAHLDELNDRAIACIEKDIRTAHSLGSDTIDKPEWLKLQAILLGEMKRRGVKQWI